MLCLIIWVWWQFVRWKCSCDIKLKIERGERREKLPLARHHFEGEKKSHRIVKKKIAREKKLKGQWQNLRVRTYAEETRSKSRSSLTSAREGFRRAFMYSVIFLLYERTWRVTHYGVYERSVWKYKIYIQLSKFASDVLTHTHTRARVRANSTPRECVRPK